MSLQTNEFKTGYLGQPGSWSHRAAQDYVQVQDRLTGFDADALFDALNQGELTQICVPYYSSIAGPTPYFSLILEQENFEIVGEVVKPVFHSLAVSRENVTLADIRGLIGHPVAVEEVRPWLMQNLPGIAWDFAQSGSGAAWEVAKLDCASYAAVTTPQAVLEYGLHYLIQEIPVEHANVTRWWILQNSLYKPTGVQTHGLEDWCWIHANALTRDALCQFQHACQCASEMQSIWIYKAPETKRHACILVGCVPFNELVRVQKISETLGIDLRLMGSVFKAPESLVSSHIPSNGACEPSSRS